MARKSTSLLVTVLLGVVCALVAAPAASAQGELSDTFYFAHDDTLETQSSLYNGVIAASADAQPDDQRLEFPQFLDANDANNNFTVPPVGELREAFEFTVDEGTENGSFTVELHWANPTIDLDMYIYRERPNGTLDPAPVAQSATANDEETATYVSPTIDSPVEPGDYWIYVDNWCSAEDDPVINETREVFGVPPGAPLCGVVDSGVDEDDFSGKVEFAPLVKMNRTPSAAIGIVERHKEPAGERVTFTAAGSSDPDGRIARYTFDLDGDGNFEYDNASNPSVQRLYDKPGVYNVGVRVFDDRGGVGYANLRLEVTGTPSQPAAPGATKPVAADDLLYSFKLSSPVFGGRKGVPLVIRYRLRKAARVEVGLYRGSGKKIKRVKRLSRGSRRAGKPYRVKLKSRGRRRGTYTIRLVVRPNDGSPRKVYKLVARRL